MSYEYLKCSLFLRQMNAAPASLYKNLFPKCHTYAAGEHLHLQTFVWKLVNFCFVFVGSVLKLSLLCAVSSLMHKSKVCVCKAKMLESANTLYTFFKATATTPTSAKDMQMHICSCINAVMNLLLWLLPSLSPVLWRVKSWENKKENWIMCGYIHRHTHSHIWIFYARLKHFTLF